MGKAVEPLGIYSDSPLAAPALELLRSGVVGHELLFPLKMATSVLGQSEAGPEFDRAEIAFGQPLAELVMRSEKIRWLHISSAGYARYDTREFREAVQRKGVIVTNSSLVYVDACVEHVVSFMLAQSRQLLANLASRCENGCDEWFGLRESCVPLRGQSVLILGYGTIAVRLIEVLAPFGMNVVAYRRNIRGDELVPMVTVDGLLQSLGEADHVINLLPDNEDSAGFVNRQRLRSMKRGAVFYNIGRGRTVDHGSLADCLADHHIAAAWLDVTDPEPLPDDHPLRFLPNCHITPHTAGGHREESVTLVKHFLANLKRYRSGQSMIDRIM